MSNELPASPALTDPVPLGPAGFALTTFVLSAVAGVDSKIRRTRRPGAGLRLQRVGAVLRGHAGV